MDHKGADDTATEFMLAEYEDAYQNVMHLEQKLFSHLSYYTATYLAISTAAIAILQIAISLASAGIQGVALLALSALFALLTIVARFELRMTVELRIRKVKFIEQITEIRRFFAERTPHIAAYLVVPVALCKAPPYLRIRSRDWYQLLYIALTTGIAACAAWFFLYASVAWWLAAQLQKTAIPLTALLRDPAVLVPYAATAIAVFYLAAWRFSYLSVTDFARTYDGWRRDTMGKESEYDLFSHPLPRSRCRWTLGDWMQWIESKRRFND